MKEHHPSAMTSSATSPRSLSANSPAESSCSRLALPENKNSQDLDCYNCYNSRLKSYEKSKFRYWGKKLTKASPLSHLFPRWDSPSPSQLSEAGFFFIGPRDKVQCFSCEIHQNQWIPAEVWVSDIKCSFYLTCFQDPWVRHTRHSPLCDYIRGNYYRLRPLTNCLIILSTSQRPGGQTLSPRSSARWRKSRMASSTHIQGISCQSVTLCYVY